MSIPQPFRVAVARWTFAPAVLAALVGIGCGSRTGLSDGVSDAGAVATGPDGAGVASLDGSSLGQLAVGFFGACFLQSGGSVGCFVYPSGGSPVTVTLQTIPGVQGATQIAGQDPFCARLGDGTVTCWSMSNGDGDAGIFPATAVPTLEHVTQVDVSDAYGCAVRDDGSVWCWGDDTYNNLGLGNVCPTDSPDCDATVHPPGPVVDVSGATDITLSAINACATTEARNVYCWGRVGVGDQADYPDDRSVPVEIPAASGALSLAMSEGSTIVTLTGSLVVFGHPFGGEAPDAPTPLLEPRASGEQIYGNRYDTFCTKRPSLPLHCTGGLAIDGIEPSTGDFDVPGTEAAIDVGLATFTACARLTASDLLCWGSYFDALTAVHVE